MAAVPRPREIVQDGAEARRRRTIQIHPGQHTIPAADPVPDDLRQALAYRD